jgi:tetratricopeptide (TPR) repeat protein
VAGICVLLAILVFCVFGQTLHFQFVDYDDNTYIYDNPMVLRGLSLQGLRWALWYGGIGHWHPLTWASHMLDCNLYGTWAGGHHLTNIILHATAAVLVFLVLFQMTGALWRCAFVAAVWAVHPLRAESVAWISERKDVLSAVFFALTLGAYGHYVRRPSTLRYLLVALLFALGLLSKDMLVTLPCVLLLLDYWPLGRLTERSRFLPLLKEKIPFFALSAISCAITFLGPEKLDAAGRVPLSLRLENSIVSYGIYLRQTVWPAGLVVEYPYPFQAFPFWELAGSLVLAGFISVAAFRLRTRHPSLLVGWFWFIGMLVPVIGLAQISHYAHADRYTYLPHIGLCLAGTWIGAEWAGEERHRRLVLGLGAVAVLCVLTVASWRQTAYWSNSMALWGRAVDGAPDSYLAHDGLGAALIQRGRGDEAIAQYREALRINPADVDGHTGLGNALFRQGRTDDAIAQYREALRINPEYPEAHDDLATALLGEGKSEEAGAEFVEALRFNPLHADAVHNDLGIALFQQGRMEDAIAQYQEALRITPAFLEARNNLGNALLQQGRTEDAVTQYREALRLNPADANTCINLGSALLQEGQAGEGMARIQQALGLQPDNPAIQNKVAWALATAAQPAVRNGARAVQLAMQASQSTGGGDPDILQTLAAAYARAGNFPDAVLTAQKALHLAEAHASKVLAGELRQEIELYKAGHPFQNPR